ncbi:MAG TPA: sensor histidine kinase [Candidatus Lokiarchaeia archaeon]|nr:sensor histidine kinase [Candidatus Lokiarchaeia archaeon]
MVNGFQIAPALLAGVALYVAAFHLMLYFRIGKTQRVNLTFAILCLVLGVYDILCTGLYISTSVGEGFYWQQAQFVAEGISCIAFLCFSMEFTAHTDRRVLIIFSLYMLCVSILAIFDPIGLVLQPNVPEVKVIQIAPDLQVIYYEVASGPVKSATYFVLIIGFCYAFWLAIRYYRHDHQKEARPLLFSIGVLFACAFNDILVVSGVYQWVYMSEYGFIGFVILMTTALSNTVVDSVRSYRQLFEDAVAISEMKSNLITFATHELKTPLVPIVGWAELLKSALAKGTKLDDLMGQREVDSIVNSAHRLTKIIETFLDMGYLESKELSLHKQDCQLPELITDAIESVNLLAQSTNITLLNDVQGAQIYCDQFRIEQVFINILSNAIKFSPPGTEVHISSEIKGDFCVITFQDQGKGISPDDLENVWRPFWKKSPENPGEVLSSSGIGLYLSKVIVEQHGGTVRISSPGPNLGTSVMVSLPLGLPSATDPSEV